MKPIYKKEGSWLAFTLLVAMTAVATPLVPLAKQSLVVAQTPANTPQQAFPLPEEVAAGTKVTIDGSSSMKTINQALKDDFSKTYAGTEVVIGEQGTEAALEELKAGKIDLAAIGRPLTQGEKAAGLVPVPISRHKIAIIVSRENPFDKSITFEQFAQIFRGEVTDWSQLGGVPGQIRFIDRNETSDTRRAFAEYDVFQTKEFKTGSNAEVVEDQTEAVIQGLKTDGIGYAIVDQVAGRGDVKIVKMHDTLPDDAKYPFSQPLYYIYKNPPNDAVKAFLGFAAAPGQAEEIEAARKAALQASPSPAAVETPTPAPVAETENRGGGFPWPLLLLLLPLLFLIPWLLRRGQDTEEVAEGISTAAPPPPPIPPRPLAPSRLVFVPRDCRDGYAYWEVPEERKLELRNQGGRNLSLRLYDTTGIDLNTQEPTFVKQVDCQELDTDLHVSIPVDDRHYLVELGYTTAEGNWLVLAKSNSVHVPACPVSPASWAISPEEEDPNRLILVARDCKTGYAYWEITDELKERLRTQGGNQLKLKIYDATNINLDTTPPHRTDVYDCSELEQDKHIPIAVDDRDYVAELGYVTEDGNWLSLARSLPVHIPACEEESSDTLSDLRQGAMGIAGLAATAATAATAAATSTLGQIFEREPEPVPADQITLVPQAPGEGYVSWRVSESQKEEVRRLGGERLALRIYDMTDTDHDERPDSVWEYECDESDVSKPVHFYAGARFYVAELGYLTPAGRWLPLARSQPVWVEQLPTPEA